MARAIATSLFMILAVGVLATPAEEMERYQGYRSPLLESLGNLKISDEEALRGVSSKINSVLGVADNEANKELWVELIAKKRQIPEPTESAESIKTANTEAFNAEIKQLYEKLTAIKESGLGKEEKKEKLLKEATEGLTAAANNAISGLKKLVAAEYRSQFRKLYANIGQNGKLELQTTSTSDFAVELVEKMNEIITNYKVALTEEFSDSLQSNLFEQMKGSHQMSHQLTQVFSLLTRGAYMLRIETAFMFQAIQHYNQIDEAHRLSRFNLLAKLLVLFGQIHNKFDEIGDITEQIYAYRKGIVRRTVEEDKAFSSLFGLVARDYLVILQTQIGFEVSHALGRRLLVVAQELDQAHFAPFLLKHINEQGGLPTISSGALAQNAKELLEVIACITALPISELSGNWWSGIAHKFDVLLKVNPNVINVAGYSSLMFTGSVVLDGNHHDAFSVFYNLVLEFLESNGAKMSPENYNRYLDQYINLAADRSKLVQSYYLVFKVHNIYHYENKEEFEVKFNDFASEEGAKAMGKWLVDNDYKKIKVLLWNAYAKWTGDKKKSSNESFKFVAAYVGQSVNSKFFDHYKLEFTVEEGSKQARMSHVSSISITFAEKESRGKLKSTLPVQDNSANHSPIKNLDIIKEVSPKKVEEPVKEKTPTKEKTPNKIIIDAGEPTENKIETPIINNAIPDPAQVEDDHYRCSSHGSPAKEDDLPEDLNAPNNFGLDNKDSFDSDNFELPELVRKNAVNVKDLESPKLTKDPSFVLDNELSTPKLVRNDAFVDDDLGPLKLVRTDSLSHYPGEELSKLANEEIAKVAAKEYVNELFDKILNQIEFTGPSTPEKKEEQPAEVKQPAVEEKEEPVDINSLTGDLTAEEKQILSQPNLAELLSHLNEFTDEEGNETKILYVKLIPKQSDCYNTLFA